MTAPKVPSEEAVCFENVAVFMAAMGEVVRKYDQHETTKWSEVRNSNGRSYIPLAVLDDVVAAYRKVVAS